MPTASRLSLGTWRREIAALAAAVYEAGQLKGFSLRRNLSDTNRLGV